MPKNKKEDLIMPNLRFAKMIINNFELFLILTQREILGPYKGAALGLWWSGLLPVFMLGIYTFIFSQIFQARWNNTTVNNGDYATFAINLFAGLIVFNLFGDCMRQAPRLIISNPNFIKKIIFPVEILGVVTLGGACFKACISLLILSIFQICLGNWPPITYIWLPIIWLPLMLVTLSLTWALSGLGVFLRDIDQAIGIFMNILMFISPIFYPASALQGNIGSLIKLNPLAIIIEQTRKCCINGEMPDFQYLAVSIPIAFVVCEVSYRVFYNARRTFADEI